MTVVHFICIRQEGEAQKNATLWFHWERWAIDMKMVLKRWRFLISFSYFSHWKKVSGTWVFGGGTSQMRVRVQLTEAWLPTLLCRWLGAFHISAPQFPCLEGKGAQGDWWFPTVVPLGTECFFEPEHLLSLSLSLLDAATPLRAVRWLAPPLSVPPRGSSFETTWDGPLPQSHDLEAYVCWGRLKQFLSPSPTNA